MSILAAFDWRLFLVLKQQINMQKKAADDNNVSLMSWKKNAD